jgi:outer membrane protein OmpA-like peptidoglycan-associated protein
VFNPADRAGRRGAAVATMLTAAALVGCGHVSALETRARVASEPGCTDFFFPLVFAKRAVTLSAAEQGVVLHAARHAQRCPVERVEMLGLADPNAAVGTPSAAPELELSRRRAAEAARVLVSAGLPAPRISLNAYDAEVAPSSATAQRRRADVYVYFQH